jgi:hypothetical protein
MNFTNLALGTVATAPSPATTGTSLVLQSEEGARFPQPSTDGSFLVTAMPPGENPHSDNSEILLVTARSTDTLTITREQGDTSAQSIAENWIIAQSIYKENILDEDDMASDSDTALATQQSIKAYVGEISGWRDNGLSGATFTRDSIDDPTVVLEADADVTDYIWKGTRIKLTEGGTTHYMIVSADPTEAAGVTTITCLMEIDTDTPTQAKDAVSTGTITDVAYAPPKTYPKGFPISPLSWGVALVSTSDVSQTSPEGGTYYNIGSLLLSLPIGNYRLEVKGVFFEDSQTPGYRVHRQALSTSASSASDNELVNLVQCSDDAGLIYMFYFTKREVTLAAKTAYYLIANTNSTNRGTIHFRGDVTPTTIRATSTLL